MYFRTNSTDSELTLHPPFGLTMRSPNNSAQYE